MEEIKLVVFTIEESKAPDSDGFSISCHNCWDTIKDDLMAVFEEIYENGKILCTKANFMSLIQDVASFGKTHISQIIRIIRLRVSTVLLGKIKFENPMIVYPVSIIRSSLDCKDSGKRGDAGIVVGFGVSLTDIYART